MSAPIGDPLTFSIYVQAAESPATLHIAISDQIGEANDSIALTPPSWQRVSLTLPSVQSKDVTVTLSAEHGPVLIPI